MGPVAHGGHCVARHEGRVVFVRHTLPGERVVVRVTEDRHPGFCRADAIEILEASPDRVERPCPYSGPGRCGGCDWQHVDPAAQRALKAAVVREQLARLAGLPDVDVTVEELPGGPLRWRSRARFAVDRSGAAGLRRHRSHDVVVLDDCPITVEPAAQAVLGRRWPGAGAVDVSVDSTGCGDHDPAGPPRTADLEPGRPAGRRPARGALPRGPSGTPGAATGRSRAPVSGRCTRPPPTPSSRRSPASRRCAPGETVLDLYAGAGLFGGALAPAAGADGRVVLRRVRRGGLRRRRRQPGRPAAGRGLAGRRRRRGARRAARRARHRAPTSSSSTRRGPGPARRSAGCWPARAPGRSSTSPVTRRRWPGTSRPSPRPATGWPRCGGSTPSR